MTDWQIVMVFVAGAWAIGLLTEISKRLGEIALLLRHPPQPTYFDNSN
ncbi:MAG: hypothetical protein Q8L23_00920 [Caulobacter sp.]|nr:hypothetical protein [Caulobacter sp.]